MLLVVRKELPISLHCRSKQKDKELGILEAETAQLSPLSRVWIAMLCELGILIHRTKIDWFAFSLPTHACIIFFFFSMLPISFFLSDFVLGDSVFKHFSA